MQVSLKKRVEKLLQDSYKSPIIVVYSGVSNIGKNAYLIIKDGKVLVIDFGIGFPDISAFGIQGLIPNVEFLELIKSKIAGIVLTHAHLDHVGGLEYLFSVLGNNIPVYGSRFTIEFINMKLKKFKNKNKYVPYVIKSGDHVKIKNFSVHFAHVTHSIPHSMMIAVDTQFGKIVYTGDYKFDDTPINERPTDVHIIQKWAQQGVLVAMLDSTNAFEQGHSKSETIIMGVLEQIINDSKGRVIIGMFSSLVSRMIGIIEIAKKFNKKVAFTGKSMEQNIKIARRIGYLVADRDIIISLSEIQNYDDKQVIILATGSQGEHMAALTRMARGKHEKVKLKSTDTVILSASVIPTNVVDVQQLMDLLSYTGVRVINSKLMDVHVSGHAYQEEMVEMAQLLQAKYYVPVHGYPSFLFQHKRLLVENGINSNKIYVPAEGAIYTFFEGKLGLRKKLDLNAQAIVNGDLVSIKDSLIEDRKNLALSGCVGIVLKNNQLVSVTSKGVVAKAKQKEFVSKVIKHVKNFVKASQNKSSKNKTQNSISQNKDNQNKNNQSSVISNLVLKSLKQSLQKYLAKEFGLFPVINVQVINKHKVSVNKRKPSSSTRKKLA